jgi:hypothetical protein
MTPLPESSSVQIKIGGARVQKFREVHLELDDPLTRRS